MPLKAKINYLDLGEYTFKKVTCSAVGMEYYAMKLKKVLRYDPTQRKFRLFRLLWVKGTMLDGGHSAKLAFAVRPVLYRWQKGSLGEWRLILLGIDIHYLRSAGGIIV